MALLSATLAEVETTEDRMFKYLVEDFPASLYELGDAMACFIANHWRKKGHPAKSMFRTKPWRNKNKKKEKKIMQVPDGKGGMLTVEMMD